MDMEQKLKRKAMRRRMPRVNYIRWIAESIKKDPHYMSHYSLRDAIRQRHKEPWQMWSEDLEKEVRYIERAIRKRYPEVAKLFIQ